MNTKYISKYIVSLSLFIILLFPGQFAFSQNMPGLPSNALDQMDGDENSLAKMLKMDLMKRFLQSQNQNDSQSNTGVQRPRPELGNRPARQQPIDLSKYLGPDGDPEKAWQMLQEKGNVPSNQTIPSAPIPSGTATQDRWSDVPVNKRLDYVNDLLERRQFQEMQDELDAILQKEGLTEDQKLEALILREKALFHNQFYNTVENDYYRLKSYYPESKKVEELKQYLEAQSGIEKLQDHVKQNLQDPKVHQQLVDQYKRYGWLDFAEEFFAREINDTSVPTIKSLSEIYFAKQDYHMLVQLSEKAQQIHPQVADFAYNEGVGLYHLGGPFSREQAIKTFQKALRLAPSPMLRQNMNWYLKRLMQ